MTDLKSTTIYENDLTGSFLHYVSRNYSYFQAQNSFPNETDNSISKANFAQTLKNFIADAIVFSIVSGVLFLPPWHR